MEWNLGEADQHRQRSERERERVLMKMGGGRGGRSGIELVNAEARLRYNGEEESIALY